MIKKDNIRITVVLPKTIHEKLVKLAEYEDRSISNMAAKIIKQYFEEKD